MKSSPYKKYIDGSLTQPHARYFKEILIIFLHTHPKVDIQFHKRHHIRGLVRDYFILFTNFKSYSRPTYARKVSIIY